MGCVNGKSIALTEEDLDFISRNTAVSREEVGETGWEGEGGVEEPECVFYSRIPNHQRVACKT